MSILLQHELRCLNNRFTARRHSKRLTVLSNFLNLRELSYLQHLLDMRDAVKHIYLNIRLISFLVKY